SWGKPPMSYEVSVVANYHKGEAFPFQLLIFLFTHNYLNTLFIFRLMSYQNDTIDSCQFQGLQ
ncbi:hypothetical protein, partial [Levilactobacillus suantsaiihabitans]|uniref:hypothetical protein n=1 Tax=Levilactobacillus suantsaiihabitans TaxID=2487722 RepID=UPI001CDB5AB6